MISVKVKYCVCIPFYSELLPRLPTDGLFSVNALLHKGGAVSQDGAFWQWQDDRGLWHMYNPIDNKIVEVTSVSRLLKLCLAH